MDRFLNLAAGLTGTLGMAVCALAGLARVGGHYYILDYQSTTVFNIGVGLMVLACLLRLEQLVRHGREP